MHNKAQKAPEGSSATEESPRKRSFVPSFTYIFLRLKLKINHKPQGLKLFYSSWCGNGCVWVWAHAWLWNKPEGSCICFVRSFRELCWERNHEEQQGGWFCSAKMSMCLSGWLVRYMLHMPKCSRSLQAGCRQELAVHGRSEARASSPRAVGGKQRVQRRARESLFRLNRAGQPQQLMHL